MCSISGFLANRPIDRHLARDLCRALLFYGAERGSQSAGVHVNGRTIKKAIDPADFIESSEFRNAFDGPALAALCHTRLPTTGGRGDEQAQPFCQGKTATVHNGYYFDIAGIKESWGLAKRSGVDSELITDFIEGYGINALPDFLETTDGPSAIAAIYDGKLYFARAGNPLCWLSLKFDDGLVILIFASTKEILINAARNIWLLDGRDEKKIQGAPEGRLCVVSPSGPKVIGKKFNRAESYGYHGLGYDSWDYHGYSGTGRKGKKKKGVISLAGGLDKKTTGTLDKIIDLYSDDPEETDESEIDLCELFERRAYETEAEKENYENFKAAQERDGE